MRVLRSAVRLVLATLGVLTVVAILLGRNGPKPSDLRQAAFPRYRPVNASRLQKAESGFSVRNVETGTTEPIKLNETERVEYAACSPWRDSQGRFHLAGLWKSFEGAQVGKMGLARIAIPGGEVLDRVVLDSVPESAPCWFPDQSAKVLFSGWDGQLYCYSFDDPPTDAGGPADGGIRKPVRLAWRNPPPWSNSRQFWEPTWPTDPRLGGRVIVSVSFHEGGQDQSGRSRTQLFWLKLNSAGTEIESLGRLIVPGPTDSVVEERLANIAATPSGGLVLAYLTRPGENRKLQLRLGTVTIDAATGHPAVHEADVAELPGSRLANQPAFSADGGWVESLLSDAVEPNDAVERNSVVAALAGLPESTMKPHAKLSNASTSRAICRDRTFSRLGPLKHSPGRFKKS